MSTSTYRRGGISQSAESSTRRPVPNIEPASGPRVLVLPFGEGALSVFMLAMLRRLMESIPMVEEAEGLHGLSPRCALPCDYFDLICGAGLGGLYAILLGRLRMSVDEILDWVDSDVRWVYGPPRANIHSSFVVRTREQSKVPRWVQDIYPQSTLESRWKRCIVNLLMEQRMEDEPFFSSKSCRTCVLTLSPTPHGDLEIWSVKRSRSYKVHGHRNSDASILQIALATVMGPHGQNIFDGSLHCAAQRKFCEPDREAYDEMQRIGDNSADSCFVEIRPFRQERNEITKVLSWLYENRDRIADLAGVESSYRRLPRVNLEKHIWDFSSKVENKPEDFKEFDKLRQLWGHIKDAPTNVGHELRPAASTECAKRLVRSPSTAKAPDNRMGVDTHESQARPSRSRPSSNTRVSMFSINYSSIESEPGADSFFSLQNAEALEYLGELMPEEKKIRVAILDTGVDVSKYPELQKACIEEAVPFGEFQDCNDEDGHGSLTAAMVNRVNPHVELFIAKVFRSTNDVEPQNISSITDALEWAISKKKVNIISMSFGFPREPLDGEFKRILVDATTNKGVLIFAASANHGANSGIPFPASLSEHVFNINSADAYGNPATYSTANDEHGHNFTALGDRVQGLKISLSPDERPPTVSGASIAAPIAAGIASLFLEFAGKSGVVEIEIGLKLRTFQGMAKILVESSRLKLGFRYLLPNKLLKQSKGNHKALGYWMAVQLSEP